MSMNGCHVQSSSCAKCAQVTAPLHLVTPTKLMKSKAHRKQKMRTKPPKDKEFLTGRSGSY